MTGRPRRRVAPPALLVLLALVAILVGCPAPPSGAPPRNIILFVGDGMGLEHVRAAGLYRYGVEGSLSFEALPHHATVTTGSASFPITDSAAAATAMATGSKVANGVLSQNLDGPLPTVLEQSRDEGKSTGLVSTAFVTHATPAAFAAHQPDRGRYEEIAVQMFLETLPTVILGGAGAANGVTPERAADGGYTMVRTESEMDALAVAAGTRLSGQFGDGHLPYETDGLGVFPTLLEMTQTAVAILSQDPDGFFLMVEGGRIDHASHSNDLGRMLGEMVAFDDAVAWAIDWAAARVDSLLVVTADHETGGLTVVSGQLAGVAPEVTWGTGGHTAAQVGVWATGPGASALDATDVIDNTDVYWLMRGVLDS